jgi:hypothetical protein
MLVTQVDEANGQVHLCIERHPDDLETDSRMVCWQFWLYDATRDSLDMVEEVPPVTGDGLFATEEYGKTPREDLTAEELKAIADASPLPDSLWPLQRSAVETAQFLGVSKRQVLRLRDWGYLREADREAQHFYETCLFIAVEVEHFRRSHPDLHDILRRRDARRLLEAREQ